MTSSGERVTAELEDRKITLRFYDHTKPKSFDENRTRAIVSEADKLNSLVSTTAAINLELSSCKSNSIPR